jgi:hypothetical protein
MPSGTGKTVSLLSLIISYQQVCSNSSSNSCRQRVLPDLRSFFCSFRFTFALPRATFPFPSILSTSLSRQYLLSSLHLIRTYPVLACSTISLISQIISSSLKTLLLPGLSDNSTLTSPNPFFLKHSFNPYAPSPLPFFHPSSTPPTGNSSTAPEQCPRSKRPSPSSSVSWSTANRWAARTRASEASVSPRGRTSVSTQKCQGRRRERRSTRDVGI